MGLIIGIRYLCGWAMATDTADREEAEWPPHPDRVFMALAAAHFEADGGPEEYQALRRLSSLGPPSLSASGATRRQVVTTFVPVNDDASPITKKGRPSTPSGSMAIGRDRQPRTFPVAIPERDEVFLIWGGDLSADDRRALDQVCRKVTAVGHSASMVQMWVADRSPEPNLVPAEGLGGRGAPGRVRLRVTDAGRLDALERRHRDGLRPDGALPIVYEEPARPPTDPAIAGSAFEPGLIVLRRVGGRPLGLASTLLVTETLRAAIMSLIPDPIPDWISGHDGPGGPPSRDPHLALLPLAHVGSEYGDGRLLGVALALPKGIMPAEEVNRCLLPFLFEEEEKDGITPAVRALVGGRDFEWQVALDDREDRPVALRPETWTSAPPRGPSRRWASVTPVVLDRYPKGKTEAKRAAEVEETIRRACPRVGLPGPSEVVATPAPPFVGVPHARSFPPFLKGGKRFHVHVILTFPEPVVGPILLGAGRYRGYGLLRPWEGESR